MSEGYEYQLTVEQQPLRARMCGLGDKDRRQVSPTPCIRLRIYRDGKMVPASEINPTYFFLVVELWSPDKSENLGFVQGQSELTVEDSSATSGNDILTGTSTSAAGDNSCISDRLYDLNDELGIWFILYDLSVRFDGEFRFKFSLYDLSDMLQAEQPVVSDTPLDGYEDLWNPAGSSSSLPPGSSPCVASVFSDIFRVYSAKKFPGVIESTQLSAKFASQGIKVPIRKEQR